MVSWLTEPHTFGPTTYGKEIPAPTAWVSPFHSWLVLKYMAQSNKIPLVDRLDYSYYSSKTTYRPYSIEDSISKTTSGKDSRGRVERMSVWSSIIVNVDTRKYQLG